MYEYVGFIASIVIFISGIMPNEFYLRMVNIIGALLMVVYGVLIKAPSIIFLNSGMIIAHIYRIIKIKRKV